MYQKMNVKIKGVAPIILHNGHLADPLNEYTKKIKEVSSKRSKTDADNEKMARLEWEGGLYFDADGDIAIPSKCVESMLIEAAKKNRLGKQFKAGVICDLPFFKLKYSGPKDLNNLYDRGFMLRELVKIQTSKIVRTRPMFSEWSIDVQIFYLDDVVTKQQVVEALNIGGQLIGLCDYRPKYGRFEPELVK
jgi:hypothetical protein